MVNNAEGYNAYLRSKVMTATPAGALQNGSSHIVVGRPITKAEARQAAALAIVEEIKGV